MNRLIVFIASVSLAFLAISSTCLATPLSWGAAAPQASGGSVMSIQALSPGLSGMSAPSDLIGGGLLSL